MVRNVKWLKFSIEFFLVVLIVLGSLIPLCAEQLKKGGVVCLTKNLFREFVENRNDQAYLMSMLASGKCKLLLSDSIVPVEVLEGLFPMVKVKMQWGDTLFIGWTETVMVVE